MLGTFGSLNMATAHQLSTIISSCVKAPVNPKTGLANTFNERTEGDVDVGIENVYNLRSRDADYLDTIENPNQLSRSGINLFDTANTLIETLPAELGDLSDDDFYRKLVELKNEHKKTLQICEQLYSQKVSDDKVSTSFDLDVFDKTENVLKQPGVAALDDDYVISTLPKQARQPERVLSAKKPPSGKPKRSDSVPLRSISVQEKKIEGKHWRPLTASSTDSEDDKDVSERNAKQAKPQNALAKKYVDEMWKNFSVDDYAPKKMRSRSSSLSRLSTLRNSTEKALASTEAKQATKEWKHKITIPKPFSMTLREAQKEPKKTKAMIELEAKRQAELQKEAEECQKKFKARPVPAHVYLPLYDEIMEEKETLRRRARENAQDVLKSKEKPFKFTTRVEEKKQNLRSKHGDLWKDNEPTTKFKAKPFPEHIFDDYIDEKMKEDEEYRKVRVQMRAHDMYKSASLPPNMQQRGEDYVKGRSRQKSNSEKAKKSGFVAEPKFKPKINSAMPDFENLHKKHMKELTNKKLAKEATVCKPFNLRVHGIASSRSKIYEDIEKDELSLRENRWPFTSSRTFTRSNLSGSLSASLDSIPAKMTNSAHLRSSATKSKLRQQMEAEYREQQELRHRALKEEKLKKEVSKRAMANDRTGDLNDYTKNKLHEYREMDRARRSEYNRQLNEMNEKLKDRPLLFEQVAERNAQQKADRKYRATLRSAGLEEDFVSDKGRRASSTFSPEDEVSTMFSDSRKYSRPTSAASYSHSDRKYTDDFDDDPMSKRSAEFTDHGSDLEED